MTTSSFFSPKAGVDSQTQRVSRPPSRRERSAELKARIRAAALANPSIDVVDLMERFGVNRAYVNRVLAERRRG